jgi:DHA2 family multidrug resistance protein-like MFS transporter
VIFSLGLAPVFTLTNDIVIGTAPPERAGAASAISETSSELGGALGIAILGSIGTAFYRGAMAKAALGDLAPEALKTARDTLGGAVAVAEGLPAEVGARLLGTARAAFGGALQLTAGICAVVAAATAVAAVVLLGRLTKGGESGQRPAQDEPETTPLPGTLETIPTERVANF